ncbi:MAG: antibiotic biosynthesis monooxygenase [Actinomycetota bacterium]|jgi:heme-degrading monooxygenase HmoA|nr:antibiotic biosynthesis monooxygenase [Actinomycetota bacterium]MDA8341517.1 antibiotic biosynthesis monooxygenase [Actinomycetota bacterium]
MTDPAGRPAGARRVDQGSGTPQTFVAFSELQVAPDGADALEAAFRSRLRAVENWEGFQGLQVCADAGAPGSYAVVSWWDSRELFLSWFRSQDHKRAHARTPTGEARPSPIRFRRFTVVAR